ncbi:cytochrome P450 [Chytridium lagenaria]|nr:cytochrome P450 [Chytridium lagenaria]
MFSRSLLGIENEPDQHTILRRIMAPPFRGSTLRSTHSEMIHHVRDFFNDTKQRYQDKPVDFQRLFRQLAVKLALIMLLNCESPDLLDYDHIAELSSAFVNDLRAFTVIARKDAQINAANGWNVIRGVAERIVKEKLATMDESETPDSIDLLVEAQRSNTVSDVGDLIQQTALILTAGHVTTGSILASFAAYTSTRPALIARLREEQSRFEDLESPDAHFPLLEATFREIERLENPVVMLRRLAKEDLRYVGSDGKEVVVKKGTLVTIDVSTTNRDPEVYERPDEFLPDRWLVGEGKVKSAPAVSLVTFGAGPRLCLGRDFARMEMIAVGCIMLRQFDWTRTEGPFEKVTFPIPQWKGGVCCYLDDLKL